MSKKRGQAESVKAKVSRVYDYSFVIRHAAGKKRCQQRWYGYVYRDKEGLHGRCRLTQTNHKCNRGEDHTNSGYLRRDQHICACGEKFLPYLHTVVEEVAKEEKPSVEKKILGVRRPKYPVKPKENK